MPRNTIVVLIGLLAVGLLLTAAVGIYRAFSYLAAGFILAVFASASIERDGRELDLTPHVGLIAGLAVLFIVGLTGIWLLWNPSMTEYTYVFGLPQSTFVYMLFLWLLPLVGAVYYAIAVFPETADDEAVEEIVGDAREAQAREDLPLSPSDPTVTTQTEADGGTEQ